MGSSSITDTAGILPLSVSQQSAPEVSVSFDILSDSPGPPPRRFLRLPPRHEAFGMPFCPPFDEIDLSSGSLMASFFSKPIIDGRLAVAIEAIEQ